MNRVVRYTENDRLMFPRKNGLKFNLFYYLTIVLLLFIALFEISIQLKTVIDNNEMPTTFGYSNLIVTSGSMKPNIPVGSLIFIKKVNPDELKVGDVITYKAKEGIFITHRIVEIENISGENVYTTKGDNNNMNDLEIFYDTSIYGKYVGQIPAFRYIYKFVQNRFLVFGSILLIILIYFFSNCIEDEIEFAKNSKKESRRKKTIEILNEIKKELDAIK